MKPLNKAIGIISPEDQDFLRELKEVVHQFVPEGEVLLYGSVARGTQSPASDYNVLVLTDEALTPVQEEALDDALYDLQMLEGALISIDFRPRRTWNLQSMGALFQEVDRDAIVI